MTEFLIDPGEPEDEEARQLDQDLTLAVWGHRDAAAALKEACEDYLDELAAWIGGKTDELVELFEAERFLADRIEGTKKSTDALRLVRDRIRAFEIRTRQGGKPTPAQIEHLASYSANSDDFNTEEKAE
jgi:hypothetical protein